MIGIQKKGLVLASKSPRRKMLLEGLDLNFRIADINVDESYPENINPDKIAAFLSQKKANACQVLADEVWLTADTIVVHNNIVLEKPKSSKSAFEMLQMLSNSKHKVYTAVSLKSENELITITECSTVYFNQLSNEEIEYYIEKYKPFDKAGAYGI